MAKTGKENFRRNNKVSRSSDEYESDSDEGDEEKGKSKKRKRSKKGKATKSKEKASDFENQLDKLKEKCPDTMMRIANLISYACMFLTGIIRFSYLVGNFSAWFLFETFIILGLIAAWAGAEGILGPKISTSVRTYFNFMDNNWGKGFNMIFWDLILLENANKGEEIMPVISIVIAIINILVGYADRLKELPATPWPDTRTDEQKAGTTKKKGKTTKELNEEKKKIEKEKARKKLYEDSSDDDSKKSDGPDEDKSSSPSSESSLASKVSSVSSNSDESDKIVKNDRWEDKTDIKKNKERKRRQR